MLITLNQINKAWTDEAREKAAEARRAKVTDKAKIERRIRARRKLMDRIDRDRARSGIPPLFRLIQDRLTLQKYETQNVGR